MRGRSRALDARERRLVCCVSAPRRKSLRQNRQCHSGLTLCRLCRVVQGYKSLGERPHSTAYASGTKCRFSLASGKALWNRCHPGARRGLPDEVRSLPREVESAYDEAHTSDSRHRFGDIQSASETLQTTSTPDPNHDAVGPWFDRGRASIPSNGRGCSARSFRKIFNVGFRVSKTYN